MAATAPGQDDARGLARRPALTAVIVVVLTIGIAANAIMFGVVDQLLLRPPAGIAKPSELHRIYLQATNDGKLGAQPVTTYRTVVALRDHVPDFTGVADFFSTTATMGRGTAAQEIRLQLVSGNYFDLLGVKPVLGRAFLAEEDIPPNGVPVAVVSEGFWRARLGARSNVVGSRVDINMKSFTIVGVAPAELTSLDRERVDVWVPIASIASQVNQSAIRPSVLIPFGVRAPTQRRREIAVRLALGVSRGRLTRQLFTESALLAAIAACSAIALSTVAARLVQHTLLPKIAWSDSILDTRVLAFTLLATIGCIMLAGCAPALQATRTTVSAALHGSARQIAGGRRGLRNGLLVAQAALSVLLLPIVIGIAIGGVCAFVASRWVESLRYETSPHDPLVYGIAGAALVVSGILASVAPARRSAAVDPATALRAE